MAGKGCQKGGGAWLEELHIHTSDLGAWRAEGGPLTVPIGLANKQKDPRPG